MPDLLHKISEAANYINNQIDHKAEKAIILGTGLSDVHTILDIEAEISYQDIPHFATTTVQTHLGRMFFGKANGIDVIVLSGRFHFYEGYTMEQITFPIRVLARLGITKLIITNISGGLNSDYKAGDLVLVNDHINLQPENPLRGKNYEELGPRFPDMSNPYDKDWIESVDSTASKMGIKLHKGVYVSLPGPNLETKAEYRYLHYIGGDMVGMSSVPEVIVARHMDLKVLMISMISNVCYPPENIIEMSEEEIIEVAQSNAWQLEKLIPSCL